MQSATNNFGINDVDREGWRLYAFDSAGFDLLSFLVNYKSIHFVKGSRKITEKDGVLWKAGVKKPNFLKNNAKLFPHCSPLEEKVEFKQQMGEDTGKTYNWGYAAVMSHELPDNIIEYFHTAEFINNSLLVLNLKKGSADVLKAFQDVLLFKTKRLSQSTWENELTSSITSLNLFIQALVKVSDGILLPIKNLNNNLGFVCCLRDSEQECVSLTSEEDWQLGLLS